MVSRSANSLGMVALVWLYAFCISSISARVISVLQFLIALIHLYLRIGFLVLLTLNVKSKLVF